MLSDQRGHLRQTADTFLAAATFFDLVHLWGTPDAEIQQKVRYAKWNAARILKAIKEGKDPNESNPKQPSAAEDTVAVSTPDLISAGDTTGTQGAPPPTRPPPATVEDAPEDGYGGHSLPIPPRPPVTIPQGSPTAGPNSDQVSPLLPQDYSPGHPGYFPDQSGQPHPDPPTPPLELPPRDPFALPSTVDMPPPIPSPSSHNPSAPRPPVHVSHPPPPSAPSVGDMFNPANFYDPSTARSDLANSSTTSSPKPPPVHRPAFGAPPPSSAAQHQPPAQAWSYGHHDHQADAGPGMGSASHYTQHPSTPAAAARATGPASPAPRYATSSAAIQDLANTPRAAHPFTHDEVKMSEAQKHARWAISALNFEDVPTAVRELRKALEMLGAS